MNKQNFKTVLDHIKASPETWQQRDWHCGTQHCFFGWAQILSGREENHQTVVTDAREWLDLSRPEAEYLSNGSRTLKDFEAALNDEYSEDGYNRAGRDRAGYDRAGRDRAGRDRAGRDRAGYDCDGFDRAGYNRAGRDRAGYDCDGFDRAGRDRAGYDCDGFDRAGYDRDGLDKNNKRKPEVV